MPKSFSDASSDVYSTIARVRERFHQHLADEKGRWKVTIGALFVFDLESSLPVLKHQGYPAAAEIKITPLKERVMGIADAVITVDRATWMALNAAGREALIDHELYHLDPVLDDETGSQQFDAHSRPKLAIRQHDAQIGAFHDVMRRHGKNAIEVRSIRQMLFEASQYNLDLFDGVDGAGIVKDAIDEIVGTHHLTDGTKVTITRDTANQDGDPPDELLPKAVELVVNERKSSISFVQSHLRIGYNRAARLIETMEARGIVGPMNADGREVLVGQVPPEFLAASHSASAPA